MTKNSNGDGLKQKIKTLLEEKELLENQLNERIMMTDALYENEQQFRTLVENIPGAVYRFRIDTEWTIEFISDKIEEITGYSASHFLLQPVALFRDIIYPDDRKNVEQAVLEGMDPMTSFSTEYRIKDANGKMHWLVENGQAVFSADGQPLWLDGTVFNITDKKKAEADLAVTQNKLIENAHQAGMADIAADTIHNVGNILNSVNTSTNLIQNIINDSSLSSMIKANALLKENLDNIDTFISENPKGKKLIRYYLKLEDEFNKEQKYIREHMVRISEMVNEIEYVIKAQQFYAGKTSLNETLDLSTIVNDALIIESEALEQSGITVEKHFDPVPEVNVQKNKLIHILVNLIRNAKEAMSETIPENRKLTVAIQNDNDGIIIKMADTGCGVSEENIEQIFSHGFTTKPDRHGLGLHSSANYMNEMGGEMWAESDGPGKGITFIMTFLLSEKE